MRGCLNLIGCSSIGPVAGSLAALVQSTLYAGGVAAGSLFAILQGIAMSPKKQ